MELNIALEDRAIIGFLLEVTTVVVVVAIEEVESNNSNSFKK